MLFTARFDATIGMSQKQGFAKADNLNTCALLAGFSLLSHSRFKVQRGFCSDISRQQSLISNAVTAKVGSQLLF